jgi:hypothetical protein
LDYFATYLDELPSEETEWIDFVDVDDLKIRIKDSKKADRKNLYLAHVRVWASAKPKAGRKRKGEISKPIIWCHPPRDLEQSEKPTGEEELHTSFCSNNEWELCGDCFVEYNQFLTSSTSSGKQTSKCRDD